MPKFTTTMVADPIDIETDESKLGQPIVEVIRSEIAAAIRAIPAGPGGHRPFNTTGHLVDNLRIEPSGDGGWSVTVPSDRLQTPELLARLIQLVPMIADPMTNPKVQAAVAASVKRVLKR